MCVSHFIPEPINFSEVTKLSDGIKKAWQKKTLKEIKNLINNQTFPVEYTEKYETVTPCMDVYKSKIQYDISLDKLNLEMFSYLFVVPKYGMYIYLGGRDFSLHGICSIKGILKKIDWTWCRRAFTSL